MKKGRIIMSEKKSISQPDKGQFGYQPAKVKDGYQPKPSSTPGGSVPPTGGSNVQPPPTSGDKK